MAKVNYDYPLNLTCNKPLISGKRLTDRWFVYFSYIYKGTRKQYKISSGLNDKEDTIATRQKKAAKVLNELDHLLRTKAFDQANNIFKKAPLEDASLSDLIDEYLSEVKTRVVYHTYANYCTIFKVFKEQASTHSLFEIDQGFIKIFLKEIKVKPQSKRSYKTYLSVFFNWLIEERNLPIQNPTLGIKIPNNLPVERHRIHSKDDIRNIIGYCDDRNDLILKTIIYLIYGAQVRISEILKIQIRDIRLNENKIVLPKGKGKVKNKSKTVLLDEPLKQYLLKLPINYNDQSIGDLFFIGTDARFQKSKFVAKLPLATSTIGSRFQKLKSELTIDENKTLYSFKHTGNVNLLINGADLIELMYKNGHSKISQTETYARQLIEQVPEVKYIRKTRDDIDFI
ncbi:tyrosine-type recombinase/integrase [Desertivirga xinjiangensis]|uniref:tyrosine-type recombinase/integrase n=1 Tax=Desertivirga xinjiangensis TaxID=539206 RepID=UPI00210B7C0E|nr:tyrosine-type recombinase/integrase [Pedobacter xinjiangensis]